jgi:hypothetical protein
MRGKSKQVRLGTPAKQLEMEGAYLACSARITLRMPGYRKNILTDIENKKRRSLLLVAQMQLALDVIPLSCGHDIILRVISHPIYWEQLR